MKNRITEIKWSAIYIAGFLAWMYFEMAMGWHSTHIERHATMTLLFSLFTIMLYSLALIDKRNTDYGGLMSWKNGFIAGLVITLIITIVTPLTQTIVHFVISPEFFTNITEYAVESGEMTREHAETYFTLRSYIMQSMVGNMLFGSLLSAVIALIVRKQES